MERTGGSIKTSRRRFLGFAATGVASAAVAQTMFAEPAAALSGLNGDVANQIVAPTSLDLHAEDATTATTWATWRLRSAAGTSESPLALQAGHPLGELSFGGQNRSAGGLLNGLASIRAVAAEDFSASAGGTALIFSTTATGATTGTERARFVAAGDLRFSDATITNISNMSTLQGGSIRNVAAVLINSDSLTQTAAPSDIAVGTPLYVPYNRVLDFTARGSGPVLATSHFFGPRGIVQVEGTVQYNYSAGYAAGPVIFQNQVIVRNKARSNLTLAAGVQFASGPCFVADSADCLMLDRAEPDFSIGCGFYDNPLFIGAGGGTLTATGYWDGFLTQPFFLAGVDFGGYHAFHATNATVSGGSLKRQVGLLIDALTSASDNVGIENLSSFLQHGAAVFSGTVELQWYAGASGIGPILAFEQARGTSSAPAKTALGDILGELTFEGAMSTTPAFAMAARFHAVAEQAYDRSTGAAGFRWFVGDTGQTPTRVVLALDHDGKLWGGNPVTITSSVPSAGAWSVSAAGVATFEGTLTAGDLLTQGTVGYTTGAGGTATQRTSKSAGVTLNAVCGKVTMNSAPLGSETVTFTMTNSTIAATDTVIVNHGSAGTAGAYIVSVGAVGAGSCKISVRNIAGGSLSEAIVLNFAVIKAVAT